MSATTNSVPSSSADHAEVGLEGGEGVVGDLGLGRGDPRDERALAGVGEADQRHVGHQLELEVEPALLPHLALLGEARGATAVVDRNRALPLPALPPLRRQPAVARLAEVGEHRAVAVAHHRALRDAAPQVRRPGAVAGLAHAVHAARRPAGVGGPGTPAARQRCGRRPARRRRRRRRRHRRVRRGARGPRAGTTPSPRRRCRL